MYFNVDRPNPFTGQSTTPGGDFESRADVLSTSQWVNSPIAGLCPEADIIASQARSVIGQSSDKTQVVVLNVASGFTCRDSDQTDGRLCLDYEVRYCCQSK